ncbi:fructosamine kinase PKL/CAK/FruK [Russula brevipes]|nr:fructosamine kinase PKL/CAK/FruK [Russula brevipes]
MVRSAIPPYLLKRLEHLEPGAQFSGGLPQILSSSGKKYYAKTGSPREKEQYVGEAESLRAMTLASPGLAPSLLAFGFVDEDGEEIDSSDSGSNSELGRPFFISEYKDMSPLTERSAAILGKRLATEMHGYASRPSSGTEPESETDELRSGLAGELYGFGFGVPTFCGATRLRNGWYETWEQCFDVLIGDLLSTLEARGGYSELCRKGQDVRLRVIPALLGPLRIKPVLLHGDLWSGNTGTDTTTGEPVIFDPSSLYGHNEADLAIGRMFGGIPKSFFEEYHKHMPKTEPVGQYEPRGELYELFHYLNHTVLFGGGYASSAQQKMERLLRALG